MASVTEFRLAVGTAGGRRSSIWTFVVRNSDVYISSRYLDGETKVSLHASGQCQWSRGGEWVRQVPGRRNADRHIHKWSMPRQIGTAAVNIFHIRIPETELRPNLLDDDTSNVQWLSTPLRGRTCSLECYITPISQADPSLVNATPHPAIASVQFTDGRWFIVLHNDAALDGKTLSTERARFVKELRASGVAPSPHHRGVAFVRAPGATRGMIELCPVSA